MLFVEVPSPTLRPTDHALRIYLYDLALVIRLFIMPTILANLIPAGLTDDAR